MNADRVRAAVGGPGGKRDDIIAATNLPMLSI